MTLESDIENSGRCPSWGSSNYEEQCISDPIEYCADIYICGACGHRSR